MSKETFEAVDKRKATESVIRCLYNNVNALYAHIRKLEAELAEMETELADIKEG